MASNTSIKTKFSKGIDLGGEEVINVTAIRHADGANGQIVLDGDLSVTGTFSLPANGDLIPSANNSQQVGQSVLRWANAHVANVYSDYISVGASVTSSLIPETNSEEFGNTSKVWTVFSDEVQVRAATPKIFMREGTTGNNYRMSVTSGQFKLDRVDASDANPNNVLYTENDGTVVFNNDIRVSGNLQVDGAQLVVNVASLQLEDTFLVLNKNHTGAATADAGITINRGDDANVQIKWDESNDTWNLTGNYSIVNHTDGGGAYVLVTSNSNATYGDSVFVTGNVVVTDNVVLTSTTNTGIIFTDGVGNDLQIRFDNITSNSIGIVYANGTFDRIATVNADARSYDLATVANTATNKGLLRLSDDNNSNDTVSFVGSGSITVSSSASQITISGTDQHTTYGISSPANTTSANVKLTATGSNTTASSVKIVGSGSTTVSSNTTAIKISSTDNHTTYGISTTGNTSHANINLTATGSNTTSSNVKIVGAGSTTVSSNTTAIKISSTDNNTTYDLVTIANTAQGILRLSDSANSNDTINIVGSGSVSVASNTTQITITGADNNDNTTYGVSIPSSTTKLRLTGSDSTTDDIEFVGSGATSVTRTNESKFTISSTDNNDNTTYDLSIGGSNAFVANLNLTAGGSGTGTDTVRFTGSGLVTVSCNTTHIVATGATPSLDAVLGVGNTTTKDISVRNLTSTGNTTLGNATSDLINTQGRFSNSVIPSSNNAYDLGTSLAVWRNIYTGDLNMSNMEGDPNEVDGTRGSWTIQEGEDDLFLINKRNGKKYKFKLEEIK